MIPKVIHYCWFGGNRHTSEMKKCIKSWKEYCPDYEILEWNESNFDVTSHPFVRAAYDAKAWAFVSDYARLKIIYDNGGIYLDTDVELIQNLDTLLEDEAYIGVEAQDMLCNTGLGFGAEKQNEVIKKMLEKYDLVEFDNDKKSTLACPYLNTEIVRELGYKEIDSIQNLNQITVYPPKYFDPYPSGGKGEMLLCSDTISIHHYSASWGNKKSRIKRKIVKLIGPKFSFRIKSIKNKIFGSKA